MGKKVSELTAIAAGDIDQADDLVAVFDLGANKLKKISVSDFATLVGAAFDINSLPAISYADLTSGDEIPVYDTAAATTKKVTVQFLFDYVTKNADTLSTIASGDIVQANDYVLVYDASLGNLVKLSVSDFLSLAGGGLTNWTESYAGSGLNARSKFLATGVEDDIDAVISPKGQGAFRVNDSSGSCGSYASDMQLSRNSSGEVASGPYSCIGGGYGNTASGSYSSVTGGVGNFATQEYARSGGFGASAVRTGEDAWSSGKDGAITGTQFCRVVASKEVVGTATTELLIDGANLASRITIQANQFLHVIINVIAVCTDVGNGTGVYGEAYGRTFTAAIKRLVNTTSLVGAPTTLSTAMADTSMASCDMLIEADDTNDSLKISFEPPTTAGSTSVYYVSADVQIVQIWL